MEKFKLLMLTLLCLSATAVYASPNIAPGTPLHAPPLEEKIDAEGNAHYIFVPSDKALEPDDVPSVMAGTWFDSGAGPGVLEFQGQWYFSDILSTSFATGYLDQISYQWSGSFNGWADVLVYLFILDPNGDIVANAEVTNATSGTLPVPAATYPADYRLVFGYIVDRPLVLRIYGGPSFDYVSASVYYQ